MNNEASEMINISHYFQTGKVALNSFLLTVSFFCFTFVPDGYSGVKHRQCVESRQIKCPRFQRRLPGGSLLFTLAEPGAAIRVQ